MTKEWCDYQNQIRQKKIDEALAKFDEFVKQTEDKYDKDDFCYKMFKERGWLCDVSFFTEPYIDETTAKNSGQGRWYAKETNRVLNEHHLVGAYHVLTQYRDFNLRKPFTLYSHYADNEWTDFDGTIIITDPGYIMKEDDTNLIMYDDDSFPVGNLASYRLQNKAFSESIVNNTLCGDWEAFVIDDDTNKTIGTFAADCGMVSVTLKSETDAYNPDWTHLNPTAWAEIPNFKGKIKISITGKIINHKNRDGYKDLWLENPMVSIIGKGINSKTGEPINFHTEGY